MQTDDPDPALAVKTEKLVRRFGQTIAVDELDLAIGQGVFFGLMGPNGAGKSTTIGLLTGTLRPTRGNIEILGHPLDPDAPWFKARMGVVSEEPALFSRLTGKEQLVFSGRMFGLGRQESNRRANTLLPLLRLQTADRTLIADYSRGMRKKLAIGCALIHAPRLLFLDEPFEGVDAGSADTIRQVLDGLTGRGTTIVLTTHILEVAERVCSQVGILVHGRLAHQLDMAALQANGERLETVFRRTVGLDQTKTELPAWLTEKPDRQNVNTLKNQNVNTTGATDDGSR
jgi:ABC-2 type transport system ATP-binding protein